MLPRSGAVRLDLAVKDRSLLKACRTLEAGPCAMSIPAPYERFEGEVLPEWIDWNGHMNLAYYVVLFDRATDLLFDELGLGLDYRRNEEKGTFVVETHNLYERELLVGERVRIATQILGSDDKRLYLGHEMFRSATGERAATQ